jgi:hypothetical protein
MSDGRGEAQRDGDCESGESGHALQCRDQAPHGGHGRVDLRPLEELTEEGVQATIAGSQVLAAMLPQLADRLLTGESAVRIALSDLDQGLRRLIDAAPRPYAGAPAATPGVSYQGQPLTPAQTAEVRRYIDWIRARDTPIR